MNSIITQLPRAQEAYNQSVAAWADVNTNELLLAVDKGVREASAKGLVVVQIGGIKEIALAEKAGVELSELGYRVTALAQPIQQGPDGLVQLYYLSITWAYMSDNRRDAYTV